MNRRTGGSSQQVTGQYLFDYLIHVTCNAAYSMWQLEDDNDTNPIFNSLPEDVWHLPDDRNISGLVLIGYCITGKCPTIQTTNLIDQTQKYDENMIFKTRKKIRLKKFHVGLGSIYQNFPKTWSLDMWLLIADWKTQLRKHSYTMTSPTNEHIHV